MIFVATGFFDVVVVFLFGNSSVFVFSYAGM